MPIKNRDLSLAMEKIPKRFIDGKPKSISKKQAGLLRLLLDAHGEYVSLADHKFRSRDVEGLPDLIRESWKHSREA
ncbi:MAG: hypothetical protein R3C56_39935 [Pirellulaceae bacterium]